MGRRSRVNPDKKIRIVRKYLGGKTGMKRWGQMFFYTGSRHYAKELKEEAVSAYLSGKYHSSTWSRPWARIVAT